MVTSWQPAHRTTEKWLSWLRPPFSPAAAIDSRLGRGWVTYPCSPIHQQPVDLQLLSYICLHSACRKQTLLKVAYKIYFSNVYLIYTFLMARLKLCTLLLFSAERKVFRQLLKWKYNIIHPSNKPIEMLWPTFNLTITNSIACISHALKSEHILSHSIWQPHALQNIPKGWPCRIWVILYRIQCLFVPLRWSLHVTMVFGCASC